MADVTINQLTGQTPTSSDVFPFSTTGGTPSTYKATLTQLKTGLSLAAVATTGNYTDLSNRPTAVSQFTNDSGFITASSLPVSDQLIKAWVKFDGRKNTLGVVDSANSDRYIMGSYNVSRVNKNASGLYVVYFANALPSANYAVSGSCAKLNSTNDGNAIIQAMGYNSGDTNAPTTTYFYLKTNLATNAGACDVITAIMVVGG